MLLPLAFPSDLWLLRSRRVNPPSWPSCRWRHIDFSPTFCQCSSSADSSGMGSHFIHQSTYTSCPQNRFWWSYSSVQWAEPPLFFCRENIYAAVLSGDGTCYVQKVFWRCSPTLSMYFQTVIYWDEYTQRYDARWSRALISSVWVLLGKLLTWS